MIDTINRTINRDDVKSARVRASAGWILLCFLVLASTIGCSQESRSEAEAEAGPTTEESERRIITLGGSVTEIVYDLGFGDKVIATDVSSTWPQEATKLPQVGYQRTLSAENILAMRPTLIIASEEAGPPAAIEQLRSAGVEIVIVPAEPTMQGIDEKILSVARALGVETKGKELVRRMHDDLAKAPLAKAPDIDTAARPRVVFIYARGAGSAHVSGTGTSADLMIALAGGLNAVGEYEGFRPVTAEALIAADPDVILLPTGSLTSMGGLDGVLALPGVSQTVAGRDRRIVHMDDLYLLGLGPRTGRAVADLASLIRGASSDSVRRGA